MALLGLLWHVCMLSHFSCVWLSATPWTMAHQTPLSMWFSRQEYWSGLPFPSPVIKYEVKSLSRVRLFATPWTVACQAPPSRGFSRQECWRGLPLPSPCYVGFSVIAESGHFSLVVVLGLLTVVASLVGEPGLQDAWASVVVAPGR